MEKRISNWTQLGEYRIRWSLFYGSGQYPWELVRQPNSYIVPDLVFHQVDQWIGYIRLLIINHIPIIFYVLMWDVSHEECDMVSVKNVYT